MLQYGKGAQNNKKLVLNAWMIYLGMVDYGCNQNC